MHPLKQDEGRTQNEAYLPKIFQTRRPSTDFDDMDAEICSLTRTQPSDKHPLS